MKLSRAQLMASGAVVVLIAGVSLGTMALVRSDARATRPAITYSIDVPARWQVTERDGANGRAQPGFTGDIVHRFAFDQTLAATGRLAHVQGEAWREVTAPDGTHVWVLGAYLGRVDDGTVSPPVTTPPTSVPPVTFPPTTVPPTTVPPTTVPPLPVFDTEAPGVWQVKGIDADGHLNVRSEPGVSNTVVARLAHDAAEIRSTGKIARVDGALWRQVEYRTGSTGWVNAFFLETFVPRPLFGTEQPALWDVTGLDSGGSLNVRSGPGTTNSVVARLAHDAVALQGTGRIATLSGTVWREMKYDGAKTGWVSAGFLTAHKPNQPAPVQGTIVMGDWLGRGVRTPAIFSDGVWYVRYGNSAGSADLVFEFGAAGDRPVVGDWNGDGIDTPGVVRGATWLLRNTNSGGAADLTFGYGDAGDRPVVGDWNGDGIDTPGVVRSGRWLLTNSTSGGTADIDVRFGESSDAPVASDWNGDGIDTPGVVRGSSILLTNGLAGGAADISFTYQVTAR